MIPVIIGDMNYFRAISLQLRMENYPKIYLYKRIVQAKLFMDTRYSQAMDLHNISNEAFFSKFHFTRLFKSIYGSTPHQYLTKVRMEKAKLLLQNEKTVTETCFDVGFESLVLFQDYLKDTPVCLQLNINRNLLNGSNSSKKLLYDLFQIVLQNKKDGQTTRQKQNSNFQ